VSSSACDSTGLPTCKTDAGPLPRPAEQSVPVAEWNRSMQAIADARAAITGGEIWTRTIYRAKARGTYRWVAGDPSISDVTAAVKLPDASYILLSSGNGLLSHAPTLSDGAADGQFIRLINTQGSNTLTLQDDGVLIGSKLQLATPRVTLAAYDSIELIWQDSKWREVGRTVKTLSTDTTSTPGNGTADTFQGRAACAVGANAVVVRSNKCVAGSVVSVTLEDLDTTATRCKAVAADGSFTVTFDAATSAVTRFRWVIAQ